ncbi:MAG: hypothetical protein JNJ89_08650 [Rubrivivax sp.]|nr:hypothetical protein [Rubrivivax sp.]
MRTSHLTSLASLPSLLVAIGCAAWMPAALAQADPGVFVSPPEGTVTVYHRKSEGSYGKYDGPVKWTHGQREWNGRKLVSFSSDFASQLMDPKTHGAVVQFNAAGQPTMSFSPELKLEWPLAAGKAWTSTHQLTTYQPPGVLSLTMTFKVEVYEDVTVPAGTYKAFKVVQTSSFGEVDQNWVVPSLGLATVKRISDRPASHPLGAGHIEGVLLSRTVPPR